MSGVRRVMKEFFVFSSDEGAGSIHKDTEAYTWGVGAVGPHRCDLTGRGVKLAVLDTGFDRSHPWFNTRQIKYWSFFGCECADVRGHGTHCAGTAAGPMVVADMPRFGVAPDAELHIYKVIDDTGVGTD